MSDTARATSEPETPPAVYDATTLGKPRMFVLGIQHMFAMFGAPFWCRCSRAFR